MLSTDVIGFGAINYDHIYLVDKVFVDGEASILESSVQPGGSAANTIFGLAKLGIKCGFVGAVGFDHEGKDYIRDFNLANIDTTGIVIKKNINTGYTVCISSRRSKRSIYISPGANDKVEIHDIDYHYVNLAKVFHLSSFVSHRQFEIQIKLVENLKNDIMISFSPGMLYALRGIDYLSPIIKRTHVLFANRKEIEVMANSEFYTAINKCLESGCKYVVVTMGKGYMRNGEYIICNVFSREKSYEVSFPKKCLLKRIESTGAGDSFAAGFLFGFINKKEIVECARIGHVVALSTIQSVGSRTGLPDLATLTRFYKEMTGKQL
jgi:ribokinase